MKKLFIFSALFLIPYTIYGATLSITPNSKNLKVGETFTVNINLDTQNSLIDGVDIRYLNFNPSILEIQGAPNPGNLMPMTLINSVNGGQISFSQITTGGNRYSGSGTLLTINFKTISEGTATLTFNHTPGQTTDSNIASNESDILSSVINGSFNIEATASKPSSGGLGSSSGSSSGSSGGSSGRSVTYSSTNNNTNGSTYTIKPIIISRNLYKGIEGEDVKTLQQFLVSGGYLTSDNITGFFGPITETAVKSYQKQSGIVSSGDPFSTGYGFVGPLTRKHLGQSSNANIVLNNSLTANQTEAIRNQIVILQQQVLQLLLKLQELNSKGI